MRPVITLLTDFGLEDGYVAAMKGVILGICPEAHPVDLSHAVSPFDIRTGAFLLATTCLHFPLGTIHLAVVDPGVGTERAALVVQADGFYFVGPDNGIFSWILKGAKTWKARRLENPEYRRPQVSSTFHGRDIFAPAAAHLALGVPIEHFGPAWIPHLAPWVSPTPMEGKLFGEIIHIDHFGNAITNLTQADLQALAPLHELIVQIGQSSPLPIRTTYGQASSGEALSLIGSSGYLEVAVNGGHAARVFSLRSGSPVIVYPSPAIRR